MMLSMLLYLLILLLFHMPYTGHLKESGTPRPASRLGLAGARQLLTEVRSERQINRMIVLAGATSSFVGTAFQAHMPEYAQPSRLRGGRRLV